MTQFDSLREGLLPRRDAQASLKMTERKQDSGQEIGSLY